MKTKRRSKYSLHDVAQRIADGKYVQPTEGPRPFATERDAVTGAAKVSKLASPGQAAKFLS